MTATTDTDTTLPPRLRPEALPEGMGAGSAGMGGRTRLWDESPDGNEPELDGVLRQAQDGASERLEFGLDGAEVRNSGSLLRQAQGATSTRRPVKKRRRLILGLGLLLTGLLLGWLVIGWWLWPVEWTDSRPWDLTASDQRTYVDLVAKDLWSTSDVQAARRALYGWDKEALSSLLAQMQTEAPDFAARQRLAALAQTVELPVYDFGTFSSLFSEKAVVLTAFLSMAPLVLAIFLVVSPMMRAKAAQSGGLLSQVLGSAVDEATAAAGVQDADMAEAEQYADALSEELQEAEDDAQDGAVAEAAGAAGEAYTDEDEDGDQDEEDEWWEEDENEDNNASVGDILTSIFEEEESELPQLEALAKDLPDVEIGELVQKSQELSSELQKSNALRARARRRP